MVAMGLAYLDEFINTAHMVDKGVVDVARTEFLHRLKVHAVPLVRYMGKGTEGLQKKWDEIQAENKGVVIPVHVRWLVNPHCLRDRRPRGEISASSVVLVVKRNKVACTLLKAGIKAAGVWY